MHTLAKDFTARTHKECVNICAHLHAQMCTRSLCVRAVKTLASVRMRAYHAASIKKAHAASIKKTHASVHTCAHWSESSLLIHTKNVCTCVHASAHTGQSLAHMLKTVRAHVHTLTMLCTCVHASVRMCVHIFFVCRSSDRLWPVRAHVHTLTRVFTARTHKECVHTHAHTCMHTCAYILCVYEQ